MIKGKEGMIRDREEREEIEKKERKPERRERSFSRTEFKASEVANPNQSPSAT